MLEEAAIQLSEASDELRHYHDRLDLDPNRLFELEQRISRQIALARKHQVMPEELPAVYQAMLEEQRLLDDSAGSLESLSQQVVEHHQLALETARQLHALRQASADELTSLSLRVCTHFRCRTGSSRLRSRSMNAISPPTAPTILSSASPLTQVSRCSQSPKWPPGRTVAHCAGDSGDHRA